MVVSTHLKNISQIGSFPQVGMKIKNVWNHRPVILYIPNNQVFLMLNYSDLARWFSASTDTPKQGIDPWNHFTAETICHYLKKTRCYYTHLKAAGFFWKSAIPWKNRKMPGLVQGISHMFLFQCQPTVVTKLIFRLGQLWFHFASLPSPLF